MGICCWIWVVVEKLYVYCWVVFVIWLVSIGVIVGGLVLFVGCDGFEMDVGGVCG